MVEAVDTAPLRAHVRLLGDMWAKLFGRMLARHCSSESSRYGLAPKQRKIVKPGRHWISYWHP